MDTTTRRTFLLALGAAIVASCGSDIEPAALPTPTTGPPVNPAEPAAIESIGFSADRATARPELAADASTADRDFAARMYGVLTAGKPRENLIFSPFSIATAFAMLLVGARGSTRDELIAVLGAGSSDWDESRNALDQAVRTAPSLPDGAEPLELDILSTPYGQNGFAFSEEFLETLAVHYSAELRALDFALNPEAARVVINKDVAEQTRDRITDLLPNGSIDAFTRLVLVNTVFFKATWFNEFSPTGTVPADFKLATGETTEVQMMNGGARTTYASGEGWQMVRLPYWGGYSMLAVLPDEGSFDAVEADLQTGLWAELSTTFDDHQVAVSLPKFDFKTEINLTPIMQELGVVDAFNPAVADLTGISTDADLYVSGAFHQATIEVDEVGTTATAATAIIVSATSAPPPASFVADRPFFFAIEHDETHEPLFVGRVMSP